MDETIIAVTFETTAQSKNPQFSVPQKICDILGVKGEDNLYIRIMDDSGKEIYPKTLKTLKSGVEVYGPDVRQAITRGQRIRVEASLK